MHTMNAFEPFRQREMNNYAPASLSLHNLEYYSIYSKWPIGGETKKNYSNRRKHLGQR